MRERIDVDVLSNLVCMLRADVDGAVWLADDDDEARFYERCVHESGRVVPARSIAVALLESIHTRGVEGVVATVRGSASLGNKPSDVFRPFLGDVASVLLASTAGMAVIVDVCGPIWVAATEKEVGPIRVRAASIASFCERLRRACVEENVTPLTNNQFLDFIKWDTFDLDWDRLRSTLVGSGLTFQAIEEIRDIPSPSSLNENLLNCDGMAALSVLAAATQFFRPRGLACHRQASTADLMAMLRVAFDLKELEADRMFWDMKRWQRRNYRYPLLRQWRMLDPLGVVLDQRYWESDLTEMLQFLGPSGRLAALKMDLDNFHSVNNSLGHIAGDEAIRLFCSIVKGIFTKFADVYRRGGDELVVLAPDLEDPAARKLAETVRARVESEFLSWGDERGLNAHLTASIGLVLVDNVQQIGSIVRLLDEAQRKAKEEGKNRVVCLP
jgi:diguanylate cyclase (GGDEF)-like protein